MENGPLLWLVAPHGWLQSAHAMYYLNPYIFVGETNCLQGPHNPLCRRMGRAGWGQLTQGSSCCSLGHFLSFLALSTVS